MLEALSYPFMVKGLIASVLAGAVCSGVGVFVVLKGLPLIGAGLAHAAFAGVALGFLTGTNPQVSAMATSSAMALGLCLVGDESKIRMDTAVGVAFSGAMALAILFLGLMHHYPPEMMGYLFGNLLSVSWRDIVVMGLASASVLAVFTVFANDLRMIALDETSARATGRPVAAVKAVLMVAIAMACVVSLQAVGELLVVALMTIPAATALQVTKTLNGAISLAVLLGSGYSAIGLFLAYYLDVPSGATIALLLCLVFVLVSALGRRRRQSPSVQADAADSRAKYKLEITEVNR